MFQKLQTAHGIAMTLMFLKLIFKLKYMCLIAPNILFCTVHRLLLFPLKHCWVSHESTIFSHHV